MHAIMRPDLLLVKDYVSSLSMPKRHTAPRSGTAPPARARLLACSEAADHGGPPPHPHSRGRHKLRDSYSSSFCSSASCGAKHLIVLCFADAFCEHLRASAPSLGIFIFTERF